MLSNAQLGVYFILISCFDSRCATRGRTAAASSEWYPILELVQHLTGARGQYAAAAATWSRTAHSCRLLSATDAGLAGATALGRAAAGTTFVIDDLRLFGSRHAGFPQLDAITAAARGVPDRSDPRRPGLDSRRNSRKRREITARVLGAGAHPGRDGRNPTLPRSGQYSVAADTSQAQMSSNTQACLEPERAYVQPRSRSTRLRPPRPIGETQRYLEVLNARTLLLPP